MLLLQAGHGGSRRPHVRCRIQGGIHALTKGPQGRRVRHGELIKARMKVTHGRHRRPTGRGDGGRGHAGGISRSTNPATTTRPVMRVALANLLVHGHARLAATAGVAVGVVATSFRIVVHVAVSIDVHIVIVIVVIVVTIIVAVILMRVRPRHHTVPASGSIDRCSDCAVLQTL